MIYRIRYCQDDTARQAEMKIEANSPNEAIVKFSHLQSGMRDVGKTRDIVTSVFAEDLCDEP